MADLLDEFWNLTYPGGMGAEIGMEPYECPKPWDCSCIAADKDGERHRCGFTIAEAQQRVIDYYRRKVELLENMHSDGFLEWMGYPCEAEAPEEP